MTKPNIIQIGKCLLRNNNTIKQRKDSGNTDKEPANLIELVFGVFRPLLPKIECFAPGANERCLIQHHPEDTFKRYFFFFVLPWLVVSFNETIKHMFSEVFRYF